MDDPLSFSDDENFQGTINLWPYFSRYDDITSSFDLPGRMAYNNYDDANDGYYTIFRELFQRLGSVG